MVRGSVKGYLGVGLGRVVDEAVNQTRIPKSFVLLKRGSSGSPAYACIRNDHGVARSVTRGMTTFIINIRTEYVRFCTIAWRSHVSKLIVRYHRLGQWRAAKHQGRKPTAAKRRHVKFYGNVHEKERIDG